MKYEVYNQVLSCREKEREQHVADVRACEDRVVHVKEQLAREKEKAIKRNNKEVLEVGRATCRRNRCDN